MRAAETEVLRQHTLDDGVLRKRSACRFRIDMQETCLTEQGAPKYRTMTPAACVSESV